MCRHCKDRRIWLLETVSSRWHTFLCILPRLPLFELDYEAALACFYILFDTGLLIVHWLSLYKGLKWSSRPKFVNLSSTCQRVNGDIGEIICSGCEFCSVEEEYDFQSLIINNSWNGTILWLWKMYKCFRDKSVNLKSTTCSHTDTGCPKLCCRNLICIYYFYMAWWHEDSQQISYWY